MYECRLTFKESTVNGNVFIYLKGKECFIQIKGYIANVLLH